MQKKFNYKILRHISCLPTVCLTLRAMPLPDGCAVFETVTKWPQMQEHVKVRLSRHPTGVTCRKTLRDQQSKKELQVLNYLLVDLSWKKRDFAKNIFVLHKLQSNLFRQMVFTNVKLQHNRVWNDTKFKNKQKKNHCLVCHSTLISQHCWNLAPTNSFQFCFNFLLELNNSLCSNANSASNSAALHQLGMAKGSSFFICIIFPIF